VVEAARGLHLPPTVKTEEAVEVLVTTNQVEKTLSELAHKVMMEEQEAGLETLTQPQEVEVEVRLRMAQTHLLVREVMEVMELQTAFQVLQ
jgi:hypothetical protein